VPSFALAPEQAALVHRLATDATAITVPASALAAAFTRASTVALPNRQLPAVDLGSAPDFALPASVTMAAVCAQPVVKGTGSLGTDGETGEVLVEGELPPEAIVAALPEVERKRVKTEAAKAAAAAEAAAAAAEAKRLEELRAVEIKPGEWQVHVHVIEGACDIGGGGETGLPTAAVTLPLPVSHRSA
jgi:hypothetical protein